MDDTIGLGGVHALLRILVDPFPRRPLCLIWQDAAGESGHCDLQLLFAFALTNHLN